MRALPIENFDNKEVYNILTEDDELRLYELILQGLDPNGALESGYPLIVDIFFKDAVSCFEFFLEYKKELKLDFMITDQDDWNILHFLCFNVISKDDASKKMIPMFTPHITKSLCSAPNIYELPLKKMERIWCTPAMPEIYLPFIKKVIDLSPIESVKITYDTWQVNDSFGVKKMLYNRLKTWVER